MENSGRQTVLVIEDTDAKRYALVRPLQRAGFTAWEAETAAEGFQLALKRPDVIVLDVKLPDELGFDVCRRLKQHPLTAEIPVLHVSATFTSTQDKVFGLEGGADGYLTEPVRAEEFIAHVRVLLRLKAAQDALRSSEERFRNLFETLPLSAFLIEPGTLRILDCNRSAAKMLGHTRDELRRLTLPDIDSHLSREDLHCITERVLSQPDEVVFDSHHRTKAGEIRDVIVTSRRLQMDGHVLHYATALDVTERRRAESRLREQLELTRTIAENSSGALFMMDANGYCTFMNPAAEKMFGFTFDEIRVRPLHEMIHHHHPNGHPFPITECPINRALPENFDIRERQDVFIRKNGEFFPVLVAASPIFKDGKPVSTVVEVKDISAQKEAEAGLAQARKELEEHASRLEQTVMERTVELHEAVAELQRFSYSLAHDLRAPLRAMSGFAEMLLELSDRDSLSPEGQDFCRRIVNAASRLDKLIQDALSYSRMALQKVELERVDLSGLLSGLIDTYPSLRPEIADIRMEANLPAVLGNESLLTQCFSNILENAVKFCTPGTKPEVRIWAETENGKVRLCVKDNGIGIPIPAQERLFEMFQKLDHGEDGSGIGLAIARKAVERMGGRIGVQSEPGKGSLFWIELSLCCTGAS